MKPAFRLSALLLGAASSACAGSSLEPFFGRGYGSTLFRMELTFPLTDFTGEPIDENVKGLGQSELEYPLDAFLAGVRYRYEFSPAAERYWGLNLGVWTNFTQPGGRMEDSDWFGQRASSGSSSSSYLYKFSYTRSRAEVRWYGGEAGADFGNYQVLSKTVRYGLSLRTEHLAYRMFGIQGWQRLPGGPANTVDSHRDELVLVYRLLRVMPRLTAEMLLAGGRAFSWKAAASGAPALAMDYDDHVLRRKDSETLAFGFEAGISSALRWRLSGRTSLAASADLAWFRTKGEMDQHFYGDDPFTSDDETGLSIRNVENRIIGLGGRLSLGFRYSL